MGIKDTTADTLIPIIACKIQPGSIVTTDSYPSYDALDITDFHHMRINHLKLCRYRPHKQGLWGLQTGSSGRFSDNGMSLTAA